MSNTVQVQAAMQADISREVERVATTSARHLDDLIGNARWFATLVIAEVAALAKPAETAIGWRFVVVIIAVILLAASVAFLVFSIRLAQSVKDAIQTTTSTLLIRLPSVDFTNATQATQNSLLSDLVTVLERNGTNTEQQARLSSGLILFLVASIVAGIAIFIR
jgi:Ca2+/Na+ antiporter